MSLSEVLVDLMDPNKAGDGVRRLGEISETFLELSLGSKLWNLFKTINFLHGP